MFKIYRLLIVDDEEIIVNGLSEIFSAIEDLDLDIYKAYSGREALEWLSRTRFDIVLTDIRMPEINGLQLMKEITNTWPQCRIIFLTGYNEFDYVYEAIQHKNVSYLLKIEDSDKVIETVKETIKDMEKTIKIEDLIHQAKNQMNKAQDLFQKEYLMHLLHDDVSTENIKSDFKQLSISLFPDHPAILLVGRIDNLSTELSYFDRMQNLNSVRFVISQNLKSHVRHMCMIDESYHFVVLIQPQMMLANAQPADVKKAYEKTIHFIRGTLEVIQTMCKSSLDTSMSFALCGDACEWHEIAARFYTLDMTMNRKNKFEMDMILVDSKSNDAGPEMIAHSDSADRSDSSEKTDKLLRRKYYDSLESYLESGQQNKYYQVLDDLIASLNQINDKNDKICVLAYYKIALSLLFYIQRSGLSEKIKHLVDDSQLMQMSAYKSWDEAVKFLYKVSDEIFSLQNEDEINRVTNTITFINQYITENLSLNLSLVKLGEKVYLNPSYLSRLYKQVTGMNVSAFIDDIRIKKAKKLLTNDQYKIYEVAQAVGYDTPASFSRFFKKMTGISPQEYVDSLKYR